MHRLLIAFLLFTSLKAHSQKLNHVLGEVLVNVSSEVELHGLMTELDAQNHSIEYHQVSSVPMNIWKLSFDQNKTNEIELLDKIKKSSHVNMAQFNHLISYRRIPDDSRFSQQWQYINLGLNGGIEGADIDMDLAWDFATGGVTALGDTIVSCIIDDGISSAHNDFGDNIWTNNFEIADNGIDDDNNGYIDDINGWDVYQDNADIFVGGGHGTPVAGIVGAKGNNANGVSGVNWDVKLMIVRGGGNEANALASYAYPYMMRKKYNETNGAEGAFVVSTNASWGTDYGQPEDAPIWCSFYDSLGVVGILNCGATINGNVNVDLDGDLPTACSSEYLVAVTNMNSQDNKVTGAGYGSTHIDLGAFGEATYTVASPNGYGGFGGTSGATPHVTGTVALLYSLPCDGFINIAKNNPAEAALLAREYILAGVDPNGSLEGITATGGRLNVGNTMAIAADQCGPCRPPINFLAGSDLFSSLLSWNIEEGQDSTEVAFRYRATGDDDWTEVRDASSPYSLDNLQACTEYEIQFRSICDTISSNYIITKRFLTEGCCDLNNTLEVIIQADPEEVLLSWDDTEPGASYVLEYKKTRSGPWNSISLNETSYLFEDLDDCSSYDFRIQTECAYDTSSFNNVVSYITDCGQCTTLAYCESRGNNDEEFIKLVQILSLSNTSDAEDNGYGSYMGVHSTNLEQRLSYDIVLAPGFTGFNYDEFFSVWFDWNQDGIFDEDERAVNSEDGTTGFFFDDFTVPKDALPGLTRMRVVMSVDRNPSACGTGFANFGETEDYCILVKERVPDCDFTISFIEAEGNSDNTYIKLTSNIDLDKIIYRYRNTTINGDWVEMETTDNEFTITNLEECTTYEFQFKQVCAGNISDYSATETFETVCPSAIIETEKLGLEIFPNPFSEYFILDKDNASELEKLEILDSSGKGVLSFGLSRMDQSIKIDNLADLSIGAYILKITLKNGDVAVQSIVKI